MMNKDNFFWRMQRGELPPPSIGKTFSTRFEICDAVNGSLEAHFTIGKEFTNPMGNIQGGIISAMLDDTMGPSVAILLENDEFAPTLNLNVSFIKAGKPGNFLGKGRVVNKGRSVCYLAGELFNETGELLATATATAKIIKIPS